MIRKKKTEKKFLHIIYGRSKKKIEIYFSTLYFYFLFFVFSSHFYNIYNYYCNIFFTKLLSISILKKGNHASVFFLHTAIVSDLRRCKKIDWETDTNTWRETPGKMAIKGQVTLNFEAF